MHLSFSNMVTRRVGELFITHTCILSSQGSWLRRRSRATESTLAAVCDSEQSTAAGCSKITKFVGYLHHLTEGGKFPCNPKNKKEKIVQFMSNEL